MTVVYPNLGPFAPGTRRSGKRRFVMGTFDVPTVFQEFLQQVDGQLILSVAGDPIDEVAP